MFGLIIVIEEKKMYPLWRHNHCNIDVCLYNVILIIVASVNLSKQFYKGVLLTAPLRHCGGLNGMHVCIVKSRTAGVRPTRLERLRQHLHADCMW